MVVLSEGKLLIRFKTTEPFFFCDIALGGKLLLLVYLNGKEDCARGRFSFGISTTPYTAWKSVMFSMRNYLIIQSFKISHCWSNYIPLVTRVLSVTILYYLGRLLFLFFEPELYFSLNVVYRRITDHTLIFLKKLNSLTYTPLTASALFFLLILCYFLHV